MRITKLGSLNFTGRTAERTIPTAPIRDSIRQRTVAMGVSVIVPVYRELHNGNLFRMLDCFSKQTAHRSNYELIIIVNNTPQAAKERNTAYIENQETLKILTCLDKRQENIPAVLHRFSGPQQAVIREAKRTGLKIRTIDLSTDGIDRNIGTIRDQGVQKATEEYMLGGKGDRILAMFDADSIIASDYIENLIVHFTSSGISALFLNLGYKINEGTRDEFLFSSSWNNRYQSFWREFYCFISPHINRRVSAGGPQIVALASSFNKIGGVPHQDIGEDYQLSILLSAEGRYRFAHNVSVITEDREREEGYNAAMRIEYLKEIRSGERKIEDPAFLPGSNMMLRRVVDKLYTLLPDDLGNEHTVLAAAFKYFGYKFNPKKWETTKRAFEATAKRPWRRHIAIILSDYFESKISPVSPASSMLKLLARYVSPTELSVLKNRIRKAAEEHDTEAGYLVETLKQVVQNSLAGISPLENIHDPLVRDFAQKNPWLNNYLAAIRGDFKTVDEAIALLQDRFPDWLNPFNKTPIKQKALRLHILLQFLQEAENDPEQFPGTHNFLRIIGDPLSVLNL